MTYEVYDYLDGHYGVMRNGIVQKARFHYRRQAEAWIETQKQKQEESYKNRKGHLHAGELPNIYQENLLNAPTEQIL